MEEADEEDDSMNVDMAIATPVSGMINNAPDSESDEVELVTFDDNGIITFVNPLFTGNASSTSSIGGRSDDDDDGDGNLEPDEPGSHLKHYYGNISETDIVFDPWQPITVDYKVRDTTDSMVQELKEQADALVHNIPPLLLPFCKQ